LPKIHLLNSPVFLLLMPNLLPNHRFIPANAGHKIAERPAMLTDIFTCLPGKVGNSSISVNLGNIQAHRWSGND